MSAHKPQTQVSCKEWYNTYYYHIWVPVFLRCKTQIVLRIVFHINTVTITKRSRFTNSYKGYQEFSVPE